MKKKKREFSKIWLVGCIIFSFVFTMMSYIWAWFNKNPVDNLAVSVIDACWGTSGVSFIGYALQNSARAFTASKFGLPQESNVDKTA